MNEDYYKVLQVDPSADPEVITAAYRRLAVKYHPDTNGSPDANMRMQRINEAYRILSSPAERARYDRTRSTPAAVAKPTATTIQRTEQQQIILEAEAEWTRAIRTAEETWKRAVREAEVQRNTTWREAEDIWTRTKRAVEEEYKRAVREAEVERNKAVREADDLWSRTKRGVENDQRPDKPK